MPYFLYTLLILLSNSYIYAIEIDENSSNLSILDKASIFIDKTNNLSIDEIKKETFTPNNLVLLNLGFNPNESLWIEFTLDNKTNQALRKTLEFSHKDIESVILYTKNSILKGGFRHYEENRKSLNPSFSIEINPHESETYYFKVQADIKPIGAAITLWNEVDFIPYTLTDKMYRLILLGMMLILLLYNTMLLLFIRDKVYLYYFFYLVSLIFLSNYYSGMISYYLLSPNLAIWATKLHTTAATIYIVPCILFTQEFLKIKQFKFLNKLFNISLYSVIILGILSYDNWILDTNTATFLILFGILIVYSGFYALYKGVQEAKYYVFGWSLLLMSFVLLTLESWGLYNVKNYPLTYLLEITLVIEALLFSIALAHKIKITNNQKNLSDAKLILFQEKEKERLNILVTEKTHELKHSLTEKEILYKELNHRVKNNFMMILSLLKLQISRSKLLETKESLKVTESRIKSIANLYEMLLLNTEEINIETTNYLERIYQNIALNFQKDVKINYDIQYEIELDSLIYVGLIFNELITNSFKYAFPNNKGEIWVMLKQKDNQIFLTIKDNGQGFKEKRKNSLGLTIVETLIKGQLLGTLNINSHDGTEVSMVW